MGREAWSPSAARASAPPIAEPPMPATTSPAGVSQSCMIADSTRHTASRRCSGRASTSPSWSEESIWAIVVRVSSSAVLMAVRPPSLICSPPLAFGCGDWPSLVGHFGAPVPGASLELDRAVGQFDTREDTRPAGYHVASSDPDALPDHGSTGDAGAVADAAAGGEDAVAQLAAGAHAGPREDHGALHGGAGADDDVLAEHDKAADVGAGAHVRAALDQRRRDHPALDLGVLGDRHPAAAEALAHRGGDVALDDVEGPLEVAGGRADVEPVALRRVAVEAVADEPWPHLALDRDVALGRHQLEHLALEHVGAGADQVGFDLISAGAYVLEREVLELVAPERNVSIEREVWPRLVGNGLYGYASESYWLDIGTPARYLQGTFDIIEGNVATAVRERLGGGWVSVAEDAQIEGRVIPPALIQRGAHVGAGAHVGSLVVLGEDVVVGAGASVERAVVLAGARVGAGCELRDCILAAGCSVGDGTRVTGGAVIGEGVRIGAGNVITRGARIFPGVELPDGAIEF